MSKRESLTSTRSWLAESADKRAAEYQLLRKKRKAARLKNVREKNITEEEQMASQHSPIGPIITERVRDYLMTRQFAFD